MESGTKTVKLQIGGMTCVSCQNKIEKKLRNTKGVQGVQVSYNNGTAVITYDPDLLTLKEINGIIEKLDYQVLEEGQQGSGAKRALGILIILFSIGMLLKQFGVLELFNAFPVAEEGMGYGMLFVIGLLTSVHCVAMCGGINLSQCMPKDIKAGTGAKTALRPSLLYNLGRVISYTLVGALVGAFGSVASLSNGFKGGIQLLAGVFMVIMGINMLGVFPWLRKFNLRMPSFIAKRVHAGKNGSNSPLVIGLLNGLMPCGPLQAMQLYALSTGSPVKGALSMLLFSLGTVPLMFGLGALSTLLSKKFTNKVMTVGAVLVVVLGISMFSNGLSLSGLSSFILNLSSSYAQSGDKGNGASNEIVIEDGYQIINSSLNSGRYPAITVQAGTPVKWNLNAPQGSINGCNNRLVIPEYKVEYTLKTGDNVIEFTPSKTGRFSYSCWMGMIRSTITVVEPGVASQGGTSEEGADSPTSLIPQLDGSDEPVAANVKIPTDELAVAVLENDGTQTVTVNLTDEGYSPAIIVVQSGIEAQWIINNTSTKTENQTIVVPAYSTQLVFDAGENVLGLYPTADFDFSNENNTFYGYVKVVDNLKAIDEEAIKKEVSEFETLIWPASLFEGTSGGASCH